MVSSPKGIVVIGGIKDPPGPPGTTPCTDLIELSGDSINTLKWTILKQKLKHPRFRQWFRIDRLTDFKM